MTRDNPQASQSEQPPLMKVLETMTERTVNLVQQANRILNQMQPQVQEVERSSSGQINPTPPMPGMCRIVFGIDDHLSRLSVTLQRIEKLITG